MTTQNFTSTKKAISDGMKEILQEKRLSLKELPAKEKLAVKNPPAGETLTVRKSSAGETLTIKKPSTGEALTVKKSSAKKTLAVKNPSTQKELPLPPTESASDINGKALTEFYVKKIACHIDDLTDTETIDSGLECSSNNLGITFTYEKPDDHEFWIYQSIYKKSGEYLSKQEIAKFFLIHTQIHHANATQIGTESLDEKSNVTFVLLTNGLVSKENKKEFERLKESASNDVEASNYDWKLIDLPQIQADKEHISSAQSPPSVNITIPLQKDGQYAILPNEICRAGKKHKTILTIIPGTLLHELCQQHGNSLFNYNIRGFLGNKSKNKKIINTLDKEPEFFYLYNNGISAICSDLNITPHGNEAIVQCKNFQIINGAQTAGSIHSFGDSSDNKKKLEKAMILIRITQIKNIEDEKPLHKNIITNNNTQNVIRDADFRSNDLVQVALQKKFADNNFQYKASKPPLTLVYLPKRKYITTPNKRKIYISMEDMAKSLYAFLKDEPFRLNSQSKFLFDEIHGSYWDLFGKNGAESDTIDAKTARQFAAIAMIKMYLDFHLKQGVYNQPVDTLLGMTYRSGRHFLWAFGYVVRNFYSSAEQKKIYNNIINGTAFEKGKFVSFWYAYILKAIFTILSTSGTEPGQTLNFKMWLRDKSRVPCIKEQLNLIKEIGDLPPV